jgi:hypothetical protein
MGTLTDDRVLSGRFGPRLALVVSDVAALTLCILGALHLFNKQGTGTQVQAIWANGVLILPLVAVAVLSFALNNLYAKAPDHMLGSSFSEWRDVVFSLGFAGCAVLGIDYFFGSLRNEATLDEPITIFVALLFAAVAIPAFRAVSRAAVRDWNRERPR